MLHAYPCAHTRPLITCMRACVVRYKVRVSSDNLGSDDTGCKTEVYLQPMLPDSTMSIVSITVSGRPLHCTHARTAHVTRTHAIRAGPHHGVRGQDVQVPAAGEHGGGQGRAGGPDPLPHLLFLRHQRRAERHHVRACVLICFPACLLACLRSIALAPRPLDYVIHAFACLCTQRQRPEEQEPLCRW